MEQKKLSDLTNKIALLIKKAKKEKKKTVELDIASAETFAIACTVLSRIMKLSEANYDPSPNLIKREIIDDAWSIIGQELERLGE